MVAFHVVVPIRQIVGTGRDAMRLQFCEKHPLVESWARLAPIRPREQHDPAVSQLDQPLHGALHRGLLVDPHRRNRELATASEYGTRRNRLPGKPLKHFSRATYNHPGIILDAFHILCHAAQIHAQIRQRLPGDRGGMAGTGQLMAKIVITDLRGIVVADLHGT